MDAFDRLAIKIRKLALGITLGAICGPLLAVAAGAATLGATTIATDSGLTSTSTTASVLVNAGTGDGHIDQIVGRDDINDLLDDWNEPPDLPPLPDETIPYAPFVTISWKTENAARLEWRDVSSVEDGFELQLQASANEWEVLESYPPIANSGAIPTYDMTGLEPSMDYCVRVIAFNEEGESNSHPSCFRTGEPGSCSAEKIQEILAFATPERSSVSIDCSFSLEPQNLVTKRLVVYGDNANGKTIDLNGALLHGGEGYLNYGSDMIEVRSIETLVRNESDLISSYERPENVTFKNGRIIGSVRLWGMAKNGQGDPDHELIGGWECEVDEPMYDPEADEFPPPIEDPNDGCKYVERKIEIDRSNQFKKSSRTSGHTQRAQANAPTGIVLDNLVVEGVSRNPLYFAPGVTNSKFVNSRLKGRSNAVGMYLDAESARNTIRNNTIDPTTKNHLFEGWDRPLIAIDGSSENLIVNNHFSNLSHGGIYLYRNCGEGGVIRHQTPSKNKIINNTFYYNEYNGSNPSVYLGSHDRGQFHQTFGFCDEDEGYPYGSSDSDKDYARHNAVIQNQIFPVIGALGIPREMIQTNNPDVNSPNHVFGNETVTEETVDYQRPAGCWVNTEDVGFLSHGQSVEQPDSACEGTEYTCDDGNLVSERYSECAAPTSGGFSFKATSPATPGLSRFR